MVSAPDFSYRENVSSRDCLGEFLESTLPVVQLVLRTLRAMRLSWRSPPKHGAGIMRAARLLSALCSAQSGRRQNMKFCRVLKKPKKHRRRIFSLA
jgi:hypothetical protein